MAAKALTARNAPQDRQDVAFNFDSASPDKPVAVTDITGTATI